MKTLDELTVAFAGIVFVLIIYTGAIVFIAWALFGKE